MISSARFKNSSAKYYSYNKDTRNSTSTLVGDDNVGIVAYKYDEFGGTEVLGNTAFENEVCYTGQVYDKETGDYYYNARYYNPEDGRFVTVDTYRGEFEEPLSLHLYAYCANNPINFTDPSGHKKVDITKKLRKAMKKHYEAFRGNYWSNIYMYGAIGGRTNSIKYFINKVKSEGKWDLKYSWKLKSSKKYKFGKKTLAYDDPGNIHFGYVGAFMFTSKVLRLGAGLYQSKSATSSLSFYKSYGDDPRDSEMIKYGYKLAKKDVKEGKISLWLIRSYSNSIS